MMVGVKVQGEGCCKGCKETRGTPELMNLAQSSTYQGALGCERRMYWTHTDCAAASRTDCPSGLVNKETGSPGRTQGHAEHTEKEKPGQDEDSERKNERRSVRKRKIKLEEWTC